MGSLRNGAIRAKILIWGPPGAGKRTTLEHVASKLKSNQKGPVKKVSLRNPVAGYALLPVELGDVKGVPTKLDFQTVPGAWEHATTRKRMLQGVDGIVFVANSSGAAMKENQKSLAELDEMLKAQGRSLVTVPVVFQWMNQKSIGSTPSDEMQAKLNKIGAQSFAVPEGELGGVLKSFAAISKMAVKVVRDDFDAGKLVEPAVMDLDLDALAPPKKAASPVAISVEAETDGGDEDGDQDGNVNPFADLDLDSDLGDSLGDFGESDVPKAARPADDDELDALLGEKPPAPGTRTNGAARFRLVSAGEPSLSGDGVLSLPIRIGNDHGEEIAMTVTVKVTPAS